MTAQSSASDTTEGRNRNDHNYFLQMSFMSADPQQLEAMNKSPHRDVMTSINYNRVSPLKLPRSSHE